MISDLDFFPFILWITNAMTRLRGSAGWSAPLLFAATKFGFLARGIYDVEVHASWPPPDLNLHNFQMVLESTE